jgi:hypothetical protein
MTNNLIYLPRIGKTVKVLTGIDFGRTGNEAR